MIKLLSEGNLKLYTKTIIRNYAISPRKSWGQNFVVDKDIIDLLISEASFDQNDTVIEIGGGIGTLTYFLLQNCDNVISYEIDPLLSDIVLKEFQEYKSKLTVITGDFLELKIPPHQKIVSNIPYNISSPFIKKITEIHHSPDIITITLQKEFADHLCAKPGETDYSRISVYSSYFYKFNTIKTFSSNSFYPRPKVSSNLVRGDRLNPPDCVNEERFSNFVTNIFCRKHKKAKNNLKIYTKHLPRSLQKTVIKEISKLEFASIQPINLSPHQILDFYIKFFELLTDFNVV